MTRWLNDDEQTAWRQWIVLGFALPAALNRQLTTDAGLSLQDFDVLVVLSEAPESRVRVSALALELSSERSRLSHHIKRMEARGLVERSDVLADGRGSFVTLTDAGRRAIEEAAPDHVETVRRLVFDALDEDDVAALGRITSRMLARLDD